jgi:hypothetical protein
MAQIAGGETDKRVFFFGAGQHMPTEPPASVHFELRAASLRGYHRSRNIGGALLCDRRFQLGMRAMTAVVSDLARCPS